MIRMEGYSEFSPPFSMNESASLVIGQPNFTTISPVAVEAFNVSQSDMYGDDGVGSIPLVIFG